MLVASSGHLVSFYKTVGVVVRTFEQSLGSLRMSHIFTRCVKSFSQV